MKKSPTSIVFTSLRIALIWNIVNIAYGGAVEFDFKKASEAAAILETQIEISISLKNLKDWGFFQKMCVTYSRHMDGKEWFEYHRTEQHSGTNSPAFAEKILVPYLFHEERKLQFRIYSDGVEGVKDLSTHLYRGYATCNVTELMQFKKLELPLSLDDGRKRDIGLIVIRAEKLINNYDELKLQIGGKNLKLYQWFFLTFPYFEIHKRVEGKEVEPTEGKELEQTKPTKEYSLVYRSEITFSTTNAIWYHLRIRINSLCNGNFQRELKVVCLNKEYIIGEFETSLDQMQKEKTTFSLVKDTGTEKLPAGELFIRDFEVARNFSFTEFLAKGLKLGCYIAIDFSSGHPLVENPHDYNYKEAITLATTALKDYIWDNKFATYGFGARTKNGIFSDELRLNSNAEGVEGVLEAYHRNLSNITSGAEVNLAPIIEMVRKEAGGKYDSRTNYFILLFIMHGEISNSLMKSELVDALNRINYLPIAVIILGMNDSNLDAVKDLYYEKVKNSKYSRDSVHFISFNQFTSNKAKNAKNYFGTELLAKLPGQVAYHFSGEEPGKY